MKPGLLVNSLKMNYALLEDFLNEAPRENDFSSGLRLHSFFPSHYICQATYTAYHCSRPTRQTGETLHKQLRLLL